MTTPIVPSITDEQLAELEKEFREGRQRWHSTVIMLGTLSDLIARLRTAEKDAARLEWLDKQVEAYGFEDIHEGNRWVIDGPYRDLRHAIDNAMEQSK